MLDISDLYIKNTKDPNFNPAQIENVTFVDTVMSKIYMILLTNKGDILGNPDFGADIPKYLWKTKFPASTIEAAIRQEFAIYIPELKKEDYKIKCYILPGSTLQDIAIIELNLGIASANILFK